MISLYSNVSCAQNRNAPEFCRLDSGRIWYFSVGHMVFRIPIFNGFSANLSERLSPGDRLAPPDPTAPTGCRDNPQQLSAVWLINWPQLKPSKDTQNFPTIVYQLNLRLGTPTDQDAEVGANESKPCGSASTNFTKRFDNGTVYCTNKLEGMQSLSGYPDSYGNLSSLYWRFFVSKNSYKTPLGGQLSVLGFVVGGASASYYIAPDVVVDYNWTIPLQKINVDPNYVIEVDQLIQKSLKQYEIDKYSWTGGEAKSATHSLQNQ